MNELVPYFESDDSNSPQKSGKENLLDMYKEGFLSDFEIRSSTGKAFRVHKFILAAHIPSFRLLFKQELSGGHVDLNELNDEEVEALLIYVYSGKIPKRSHWLTMVEFGHKHGMKHLEAKCQQGVVETGQHTEAVSILKRGSVIGSKELKEKAYNLIKSNYSEIRRSEAWLLLTDSEKDGYIDWLTKTYNNEV